MSAIVIPTRKSVPLLVEECVAAQASGICPCTYGIKGVCNPTKRYRDCSDDANINNLWRVASAYLTVGDYSFADDQDILTVEDILNA